MESFITASPTLSKTTSTPTPSVASNTALFQSSLV
jgi:hypothetical protein